MTNVPLFAILAPRRCAGCGIPGDVLCGLCLAALTRLGPPGCERCGAPGPWPLRRCAECAGRRIAFASARAAVAYDAALRPIVAAWKEGGRRDLSRSLADLVAETLAAPAVDCLTFVPGDRERGLVRGHVPAESLAQALGRRWRIDVVPLLRRTGPAGGPRQAELRRLERRANVTRAFRTAGPAPARVCLVDDIYTTGATVGACATQLRRAGAHRVDVVTLARTIR